jgi:hypothetical protein
MVEYITRSNSCPKVTFAQHLPKASAIARRIPEKVGLEKFGLTPAGLLSKFEFKKGLQSSLVPNSNRAAVPRCNHESVDHAV